MATQRMKKIPTRGDALNNRELLLDAADSVFAELGVHVPLELVIERAGVSRATLYRNFVDREALVKALLDRAFVRIEVFADELGSRSDGLFEFITLVAQGMTTGAPLLTFWDAIDREHQVIQETVDRFSEILKPLLRSCKAAKLCRPDLTVPDLILVFSMLSGSKSYGAKYGHEDKTMKRALELCFRGMTIRK